LLSVNGQFCSVDICTLTRLIAIGDKNEKQNIMEARKEERGPEQQHGPKIQRMHGIIRTGAESPQGDGLN
jgi:hypothetical protein